MNNNTNQDKILKDIYYNPKQAGSFYATINKIHENPILRSHRITKHYIREWLKTQETLSTHIKRNCN